MFDGDVNIVGSLRGRKIKVIIKSTENKKNEGKPECLSEIDFGFICNSKTNDRRYIKFPLNVYISIFYTEYNLKKVFCCTVGYKWVNV